MKANKELECPYTDKALCIDVKCFRQKTLTKPELNRKCDKCAWGPKGEKIMASRLEKLGYINIDGKWHRKSGVKNG